MKPPVLACFITSHGFGHATRTLAVLDALRHLLPEVRYHLFARLPRSFLTENLPAESFELHETDTDVGLVQNTPFRHDLSATLARLDAFLPFASETLAPLAHRLRESGCDAVLCDVSPLGIAAARAASLPSVLLENFSWDWIYEDYLAERPAFAPYVEQLGKIYAGVDLRLQTEPVCHPLRSARLLPPVVRPFRLSREETRERLNLPPDVPLVLLTTGGIPGEFAMKEALFARPDVRFLLSGSGPELRHEANLVHLPHDSGLHHPDLVRACDLVVGKAGYGTVAEVLAARKPFARILRSRFRESDVLARFMDERIPGFSLSSETFAKGSWLDRLDELLALPAQTHAVCNGAEQASRLLIPLLRPSAK